MNASLETDFSSYSLEVLLQEPDRLTQSIAAHKQQFDRSMATHYDFFIKTCENASKITDDLESCSKTVSDLNAHLSHAHSLCDELCADARKTITANSQINAALDHLTPICGIIEVPQYMRTFLFTSMHQSALDLCNAMESFARQYPGVTAIQTVLEKAKVVKISVADSLLSKFHGKLQIPAAATVVNQLRTAGLHTEQELRLALVAGRRKKLHSKIEKAPKQRPELFIESYTQSYRKAIHKLLTLYQAVFRELDDDITLNMFIHAELGEYCGVVGEQLDRIKDAENAREAMKHVLVFAQALAGLGFNFSPMVDAMFYASRLGKGT
jgi:hypothetical protein